MLAFKDFSSDSAILEILCKMRVKLAHRRNKEHFIHLHTLNPNKNYHKNGATKSEALLCSLFPPRKKWKTVLQNKRIRDGVTRSTSEKTLLSLRATIKYYQRTEPNAEFLIRLNNFIKGIQDGLHQGSYKIGSPKIIPKLKEDKPSLTATNICRPIASFGLKDKIILSITNRYLTAIFDPLFIERSYAFRYKRLINGIIHPNQEECALAFDRYLLGIKSKKLVVHPPVNTPYLNPRDFWTEKSKSCYMWGSEHGVGSPWIGFVGYEIHYQGYLRARKSSLIKEMKKQFKVVGDLKLILKDTYCRSSVDTIYESVVNRLIGMSVGRVTLWNYKSIKNEMCWTSGYRLLTDNKYTRIQLKRLDSSRNRLLLKLRNKISKMKANKKTEESEEEENIKSNEQIYYGSPFSYYYQKLKDNG